MHRYKSWTKSGVSEVVGTILILGMTVVLFSTIIVWVASIPTPQASIRLDMDGQLSPVYDGAGAWIGANVTIDHRGGETLMEFRTRIYLTVEGAGGIDSATLRTRGISAGIPYGIDGPDEDWDAGERWSYTNYSIGMDDRVSLTVVDTVRSLVLWSESLLGAVGVHPPLFLEKWADRIPTTQTIDIALTNKQFTILSRVMDPDADLNRNSVYVYLAFLYGTPLHRAPQRMYDDGTNGDLVADDSVYTSAATFYKPPALSWDGGVVIFNATDLAGHAATSRMTLEVQEGPTGPPKRGPGDFGTGRPPNLNYNGLQGFNIFNGTEWDENGFNATDTRTFKESEEVVVVVGSAILTDTFGRNKFILFDPFSNLPLDPVVYGTDKRVTSTSEPSSSEAFEFLQYNNGYNLFIFRFELNNASTVGVNFKLSPARPPEYFFGFYPLEIDIIDFLGNRFYTTDTIEIGPDSGSGLPYPRLETFSDPGYTTASSEFASMDVVYARIRMKDLDVNTDNVIMGNVVIQDFLGGLQVFRTPVNGHDANPPICPVTGACSGRAVERHGGSVTYRFALNLSLANQDPWIEGIQHYSFRVLSIKDSNEEYSLVLSAQLVITSPLYRLDLIVGNGDTQNNAWGTHDVSYYFLARNGVDLWSQDRIHSGATKTIEYTKAISYLDFDGDNDLDVVASITYGAGQPSIVYLYRQDIVGFDIVWTRSTIEVTGNVLVNDIRTGSLNKDTAPEIVVGGDNGQVWYYPNDGSWWSGGATRTPIDSSRTGAVNAIDLGDFDGDDDLDVVVARAGGTVTYYPNLDGNGRFTTTDQTDQWYADTESTPPVKGTISSGSYLNTFLNDDVNEVLAEAQVTQSATWNNQTAIADHSTNPGVITSGSYVTTQTQNDIPEIITETTTTGSRQALTHKWRMSLPTGGTKTFYLDAYRQPNPADDTFAFAYSTDDATYNALVTVTAYTDTDSYLTATIPSTVSGTVYIRVQDSQQSNFETIDSIRVDHMYVEVYYAPGQVSALEHYWRLQQLPNRPGSTYTFSVRASRNDVGAEGDDFRLAYSTTGQFGTYTDMVLVNQGTETLFSYTLPSLGATVVWVRAVDTDRTVGRTQLATLTVDEMYIQVYTPGGLTGSDINLPGDASNVVALDAGNYNEDAYDDAFVGTANGNAFRLTGSAGGLQPPGGSFATGLGTIGGIKIGNVTNAPGLEVAIVSNTLVRVFQSDNGFLLSSTSAVPNGKTITTLSMGDVDGDGDDDLIVGTDGINNAAANIVYYRNMQTAWTRILIDDEILAKIYDSDLGDMNKAQYVGR